MLREQVQRVAYVPNELQSVVLSGSFGAGRSRDRQVPEGRKKGRFVSVGAKGFITLVMMTLILLLAGIALIAAHQLALTTISAYR